MKKSDKPHRLFILHPSCFILLLLCCTSQPDTREHLEFWGLGREGEVVSDLIPQFEKENPGIKVTVQQIPWTAAHEKLLTAYVGEATPDCAQMGNTWIPEFVTVRALADIGPLAGAAIDRRDYFPGIWDTNIVAGVLYGIPWYVDTRVMFYRSDILADVGFPHGPRTWSEWHTAMQRIRDGKKARYAILLPTNEWEPTVMLALSNHSTLLDPAGTRGEFRQPPFAQAFSFYVDIFRQGYASAASNTQVANLYQQFAQGDFAIYISGPWQVGEFKRRLPADMQDKWATCPLPARDANEQTGVSMAGGSSLVIFESSPHKAAARKLIAFLSRQDQQVRFFQLTGDLPARRSAWQVPALTNEPHFPAFREQLEHVIPLPKVPEWEQIATSIFDRGEAAARGAQTVAAALAALDSRADELLEKRRWMMSRRAASLSAQKSPSRARQGSSASGGAERAHPLPTGEGRRGALIAETEVISEQSAERRGEGSRPSEVHFQLLSWLSRSETPSPRLFRAGCSELIDSTLDCALQSRPSPAGRGWGRRRFTCCVLASRPSTYPIFRAEGTPP